MDSEAHGLGAGLNTVNPSGSPISPHGSRGFTGWPLLLLLLLLLLVLHTEIRTEKVLL